MTENKKLKKSNLTINETLKQQIQATSFMQVKKKRRNENYAFILATKVNIMMTQKPKTKDKYIEKVEYHTSYKNKY